MERTNIEVGLVQESMDSVAATQLESLNDLQLALVGGGIADGSFH